MHQQLGLEAQVRVLRLDCGRVSVFHAHGRVLLNWSARVERELAMSTKQEDNENL